MSIPWNQKLYEQNGWQMNMRWLGAATAMAYGIGLAVVIGVETGH